MSSRMVITSKKKAGSDGKKASGDKKAGTEGKKWKGKVKEKEACHHLYSGWWLQYFLRSLRIKSKEKAMLMIEEVTDDAHYFPCSVCRPHFMSKMETTNFDFYLDMRMHTIVDSNTGESIYIGMFRFFFDFKNEINKRTGKEKASFEHQLNYYREMLRTSCQGDSMLCAM